MMETTRSEPLLGTSKYTIGGDGKCDQSGRYEYLGQQGETAFYRCAACEAIVIRSLETRD